MRDEAMTVKPTEFPASLEMHRVLTSRPAAEFCGYEVGHWRALHRAGKTPAAIKLSARKYGWRVADLVAWCDAKKELVAA
jgi:hypothetical protein